MEEYLAQSRYKEEGLGPVSSDVTDFVDFPWEDLPFLRKGWDGEKEEGIGRGKGEQTGIGM